MDFKLVSKYRTERETSRKAIGQLVEGLLHGDKEQTAAGSYGLRKDLYDGQRDRTGQPSNAGAGAQQDARCTAVLGVPGVFSGKMRLNIFVSYYDYYQPEAYIATTDTYIEKDSAINDEIDKLRHSATSALSERRDVIIVASVSCIYSLGDPIDYRTMVISLRPGMQKSRDDLLRKLVEIQYERNDINLSATSSVCGATSLRFSRAVE